jgi:hypothetical protein
MKRILSIILFFIVSACASSQPKLSKVFERKYSDLSIKNRIENSGIYGIASFDIADGEVFLSTYDSPDILSMSSQKLAKHVIGTRLGLDVLAGVETINVHEALSNSQQARRATNLLCKKSYVNSISRVFVGEGGELANSARERISVHVVNRDRLVIGYTLEGFTKKFEVAFPSNLAYADLIGIDGKGNSFLIVETYLSEIPLYVQREVYTLAADGRVMSILVIPSIQYCSTMKDFQIDEAGNLYHLLTEREGFSVLKWSGLTEQTAEKIRYPVGYDYSLHFNDIVPTQEPPSAPSSNSLTQTTRSQAIRIGESYVLHKYFCSAANLTPTAITAPDGHLVATPARLIVGENARVAYKWGGFNTIDEYDAGLQAGRYAGNVITGGGGIFIRGRC